MRAQPSEKHVSNRKCLGVEVPTRIFEDEGCHAGYPQRHNTHLREKLCHTAALGK